jgi:eukaryotic-like serine/threonine-protein kinase
MGTTRVRAGDRIGLYTVEDELGTDATGASYRAMHQVLPRRAVIKVMHAASVYPPLIKQPLAVHVLREACILEALHHPGVIRLYESGLLADRRPWFACEYVEGASVESILAPGTLDRVDAIALLRDVADVLGHAFRRGIIHCGLRPDRIVLTGRSRGYPVCITDWSEARTHDSTRGPAPLPSAWQYTSPELAYGDPIDDRADVFALGVIAYQLFTGQLPFGEDMPSSSHIPAEVHSPDLPRELTGLVDSMIAYDRWDRPAMAECHEGLRWIADALATPVSRPEIAALRPEHAVTIDRIRKPRWTPNVIDLQRPDTERMFELLEDEQ